MLCFFKKAYFIPRQKTQFINREYIFPGISVKPICFIKQSHWRKTIKTIKYRKGFLESTVMIKRQCTVIAFYLRKLLYQTPSSICNALFIMDCCCSLLWFHQILMTLTSKYILCDLMSVPCF